MAIAADFTPGTRAQVVQQLVEERHRARCIVAAERRRELERDQVVERDAGVGGLEVLQAADEQPGAEQQQEAERDLRRDQPLAQEQRSAGAGDRADRVLQRRPRIRTAGAQRRQKPEDDAGQEGQAEREGEDAAVGRRLQSNRLAVGRARTRAAPWVSATATATPTHAADRRQHETLDQQLAHQLTARGAERQPDRDFLLPHEAARDQQVRDVGAGDQQHESDHAHQHDQRRREVVAQLE